MSLLWLGHLCPVADAYGYFKAADFLPSLLLELGLTFHMYVYNTFQINVCVRCKVGSKFISIWIPKRSVWLLEKYIFAPQTIIGLLHFKFPL